MPIDIGGVFNLNANAAALKIDGAVNILNIDTTGRTTYPNQIGFIAGISTDPGWVEHGGSAWAPQTHFNVTTYNKGGGWSNPRFTAPVAGSYLFHWTAYQHKSTAPQGAYMHPMFWFNGGANQPTSYRMRAYDTPSGGYAFDSEIADIFFLNVGDYVEVQLYHSSVGGFHLYRAYSQFSGFLVG